MKKYLVAFLILGMQQCFAYYAYVVNSGVDEVAVIDTTDNTIIARVPVGHNPQGVAVTPDGHYAYVSNYGDNTILVIDTTNNTVVRVISDPSLNGPLGIAFTPNGSYVYVTNNGSNTVSIFSTSNFALFAEVTTDNWPVGVAITPNGSYAYVANNQGNTATAIDTADPSTTVPITINASPFWVAITPDSNYAYVTNYVDSRVSIIDTANNTLVRTVLVQGNPRYIAMTPDGSYAYVTNDARGVISIINTTNFAVEAASAYYESYGIAITPDGNYAYLTSNNNDLVVVFNIADQTESLITLSSGAAPLGVAITAGFVAPPVNLTGKRKTNTYPFQKEFADVLTWNASPSPSIASYNIYRDDSLIGSVSASSPLLYIDYSINKQLGYTYGVVAVNEDGTASAAATVFVQ